jgi:hypothetical protein
MLNLTKSQMADLNSYFSITSFDEVREAIFQESIQAASAAMESLIQYQLKNSNCKCLQILPHV